MKRRLIDENGRLFGKISIIDVLVIIVAVVLIGGIYLKFNVLDKTSTVTPTGTVTYQVKVSGVREAAVSTVREGDTLYSANGSDLGRISSVTVSPAERVTAIADGTLVMSAVQNRSDMTITVEAPCTISDGRYYLDRTFEVNVNHEFAFLTKYNSFSGTVISLTETEG